MDIDDMVRITRSKGLGHLADEMEYLWENPDEFEQGGMTDERIAKYDEPSAIQMLLADLIDKYEPESEKREYLTFMLGVCFGVEYNEEYPQDPDAAWREEYDHEMPEQYREDE